MQRHCPVHVVFMIPRKHAMARREQVQCCRDDKAPDWEPLSPTAASYNGARREDEVVRSDDPFKTPDAACPTPVHLTVGRKIRLGFTNLLFEAVDNNRDSGCTEVREAASASGLPGVLHGCC